VIPKGFGQAAGLLWEPQPEIQLGVDPSRTAEAAMLEGFLMQATAGLIGSRFQDPQQFLPAIDRAQQDLNNDANVSPIMKGLLGTFFNSIESVIDSAAQVQSNPESDNQAFELNFANIKRIDVSRQVDPNSVGGQVAKLRSRWDISFPQAMMWGILGCVAGFAISLARERSQGTLVRLRAAPLTKTQILIGKALACFLTCLLVIGMMTVLGVMLGMKPASYPKLIAAALVTSFCFVGIMMSMSVLGKSEESVNGSGWAINMVMAMLGGGMIPVMFMPGFLQQLSVISPIHWAIRLIEGAIWREFSWIQLATPAAILLFVGLAGLTLGAAIWQRRHD
jgi:ABC-2 type transport system permease protein